MCRRLPRLIASTVATTILLISISLTVSGAPLTQSTTCVRDYTVQLGDSVSAIAEKYHGNVLAYPAIVEATNQVAQENSRYEEIVSADLIEPGQVLCIPSQEEAQAMLEGSLPAAGDQVSAPSTLDFPPR